MISPTTRRKRASSALTSKLLLNHTWHRLARSQIPPGSPPDLRATSSPPPGTAPSLVLDDAHRASWRQSPSKNPSESVLTLGLPTGHLPADTVAVSRIVTIFEDTPEIQRMIIGRAVTGLNVR